MFAHRGGAALAPENTLAAFETGLALGADGIELDVCVSRDGIVVVHHDRTLDRTTDRTGEVAGLEAQALARVDAGYRFGSDGHNPFRGQRVGIPRLTDVLARFRDCRVIIEMKINSSEFASAVVEVVRRADAIDRVCLGSFSRRGLRHVRTVAPALATSAAHEEVRWALYRSWCRWPVSRPAYSGYQIPERAEATRVVSPRFVRDAHTAGLGVQVWTVDTEAAARRLLSWGVDGLITDRPDVMVPLVSGRAGPPTGQAGQAGRAG